MRLSISLHGVGFTILMAHEAAHCNLYKITVSSPPFRVVRGGQAMPEAAYKILKIR